jgi:hypothetical protein
LAAPPHEPTSRVGRVLIATTGTVSLLLVGILALSMTPDRLGTPDEALTATSVFLRPPASEPAGRRGSGGAAPTSTDDPLVRTVSTEVDPGSAPPMLSSPSDSMATTAWANPADVTTPEQAVELPAPRPPSAIAESPADQGGQPTTLAPTVATTPIGPSSVADQGAESPPAPTAGAEGVPLAITEAAPEGLSVAIASVSTSSTTTTSTSTTTSTTSTTSTVPPVTIPAKQLGN